MLKFPVMKKTIRLLSFAVICFGITSCSIFKKSKSDEEVATHPLATKWTLYSYTDKPISTRPYVHGMPYLEFDVANNKVSGNTGCNGMNASITLEDEKLSFGPVMSTKMACQGINENGFLSKLKRVNRYKISKGKLQLYNGKTKLMELKDASKAEKA